MLYILIILWAYVAIVLALKYPLVGTVPFTRVLQSAAVLIVLAPLLIWAARIDWYGDAE